MTEKCLEKFFSMPAGSYCGLLIREPAAKKLQKILWRQTQEIKEFLMQHKDELEADNWTLGYPECNNGKQTVIRYFDGTSREDVERRIALIDKADRLHFEPFVFHSDKTYAESRNEVQDFFDEHYGNVELEKMVQEVTADGNR